MTSGRAGGRGGRERRQPARPKPARAQRIAPRDPRITDDPDRPGGRLLTVHGIPCSYVDLDDPTHLEFEYVRRIGDVVDALPEGPIDAVHLGGGGFTLPRYVAATRPGSRQVAFEIDGELVELARAHLGLRGGCGLKVRVGDARAGLAGLPAGSADLVVGDVFHGTVVPPHLATVEAARGVRRVLRDTGLYAMNVIDRPPLAFARSQASVLLRTFTHVGLVAEPGVLRGRRRGNLVLLGSDVPLPLAVLTRRAAGGAFPERVLDRGRVVDFAAGARAPGDADVPAIPDLETPALSWGDAG